MRLSAISSPSSMMAWAPHSCATSWAWWLLPLPLGPIKATTRISSPPVLAKLYAKAGSFTRPSWFVL